MTGFVNRTAELERLRELFESPDAALGIVYGRRRLGKTRLVKTALEGYDDAIYYQARQKTATLQLEQFVEAAAVSFPGIEDIRPDWERLFEYSETGTRSSSSTSFPIWSNRTRASRRCCRRCSTTSSNGPKRRSSSSDRPSA